MTDAAFRRATKTEFPELSAIAVAAANGGLVAPVAFPTMPVTNAALAIVPDKRVLLIGGYSATQAVGVAHVLDFDPVTKVWSYANPLPQARSDATVSFVNPQTLMLFGGWDDERCVAQTLLLKAVPSAAAAAAPAAPAGKGAADPNAPPVVQPIVCDWKTATWEALPADAVQPPARRMHSACVLFPSGATTVNATGRAFIFGGFSGTARLGDLWSFSGDGLTWTKVETTGFAPSARDGASLAADHASQRLFLFGGYTCNRCDDVYLLDVASSVWTRVSQTTGAPSPRFSAFAAIASGFAIVGLGQDAKGASSLVAQYNLADGRWSAVPIEGDELDGRIHTSWGVAEGGKRVVLFGGTNEKKYSTSLIEVDLERPDATATGGKGAKK